MDFTKYFTHKIYTTDAWKMTLKNHIVFWDQGLVCGYLHGIADHRLGFLGMAGGHGAQCHDGLNAFLVFQLAHVVENTEFEHVPLDMTKHIETAWAEHQVKTTSILPRTIR